MDKVQRIPKWLKRGNPYSQTTNHIKKLLRSSGLNTVCEEAKCPNISECFSKHTATFMINGDICTRGCRFCAVQTGKPLMSVQGFKEEAKKLAQSVDTLGLKHVVITSVNRDDLSDGGAEGFCLAIDEVRKLGKGVSVEVLVPDFLGDLPSLKSILELNPEVFNHNLETVPRLYRKARPGAKYERSLEVLNYASRISSSLVKTGIMLGLGEREEEVFELMKDCKDNGVQSFVAGQYMRPSASHLEVERYLEPREFDHYQNFAQELGFEYVSIAPLVRSSYNAQEVYARAIS